MRRLSSFLIVLVILVIVIGFYRGWFTLSGGRESNGNRIDVNLAVDPDKVKQDAETVKEKASEFSGKAKEAAEDNSPPEKE